MTKFFMVSEQRSLSVSWILPLCSFCPITVQFYVWSHYLDPHLSPCPLKIIIMTTSAMTSSASVSSTSVPTVPAHSIYHSFSVKVNDDNFLRTHQIESYLHGNKLFKFVDGSFPCPVIYSLDHVAWFWADSSTQFPVDGRDLIRNSYPNSRDKSIKRCKEFSDKLFLMNLSYFR